MGLLGSFFVQFESKGAGELRKEFNDFKKQLEDMSDRGDKIGTDMKVAFRAMGREVEASKEKTAKAKEQMDKYRDSIKEVGRVGVVAFAAAEASLIGFVRAGFQGTAEAAGMEYEFKMLSQEIAAVFLPVMQSVMETVHELTDWFRSLSGAQQNSLMKWGLWIGGLGTALIIIPKVIGIVKALMWAIRGLWTSMGPVGWAILAITALIAGVTALYQWLKPDEGKKEEGHRDVTPGTPSITSDLAASHRNIQMRAAQMGQTKEKTDLQKIAENTGKGGTIEGAIQGTTTAVKAIKPPVGR